MSHNRELVDHLIRTGALRSPLLIEAFLRCDRVLFVPEEYQSEAYSDIPLPIGYGQTISQPYTVAIMLELLHPEPGNRILDVGSGSGWTTALLAAAVGENGYVEGLERIEQLVGYGKRNLEKVRMSNALIEKADPRVVGKPGDRYDRILVSASALELPESLYDQLNPLGKLVIPVRNSIWCMTKDETGRISGFELPGFRFVPLILPYE